MSKNIQATFWAGFAILSVIVGVLAVKRQLPARPFAKTSAHKISKPASVVQTLANIFIPTTAPTSATSNAATMATTSTSTAAAVLPRRKPKSTPQISYGDAVTQYANSRIQFDQSCQAFPSHMAVANPVTLMLDNRSNMVQKITINGKVYGVAAYNYVIVTIKEKTLPAYLYLNCNNSVNVAEMILE